MSELRVQTKVYSGPLDLLLYLCRRAEVDVYELPVAEIAEQYIRELEQMEALDLEFAGDFLAMAATLLKLKSDLVLARETGSREAEQERSRLVRQLLEYKRLRDLSALLERRYDAQALRHGRPSGLLAAPEVESDNDTYLEDFSVVDLFRVYFRFEGELAAPSPHLVAIDGRSVRDYIELVLAQLRATGRVDFSALVGAERDRAEVIGNFLALLELVKQHEIEIEQSESGEITILPAVGEKPRETGAATPTPSEEE